MSIAGYFAVGKRGRRWDVQLVERVKEEAFRDVKPLEEGETAPEVYRSLKDYDPVLRAHCRLDGK